MTTQKGIEVSINSNYDKSGTDEAKKEVKSLKDQVGQAVKKLAIFGTAVAGAVAGAVYSIQKLTKPLDDIHQTAQRTGLSAQYMRLLGQVAETNGGQFADSASSLENFNRVVGEARAGVGRGSAVFKAYGISIKDNAGKLKSVEQLLGDVAEHMNKLDKAKRSALASKLGINQGLVQTLSKGRSELAGLIDEQKNLTLLPDDAEAQAANFNDNVTRLKQGMRDIAQFIAFSVIPMINNTIKGFQRWRVENKELIKQVSLALAGAIEYLGFIVGALSQAVGNIVWAITAFMESCPNLSKWLAIIASGILLIVTGFNLLGKALKANPIGVALTGILLACSLVTGALRSIQKEWGTLGEFFSDLGDYISGVFESVWLDVRIGFSSLINGIINLGSRIIDAITSPFKQAFEFIDKYTPDFLKDIFTSSNSAISGYGYSNGNSNTTQKNINNNQQTTKNNTINNNIIINNPQDPLEVARIISDNSHEAIVGFD